MRVLPWERRPEIVGRFSDQRLKRLARRIIYFESPHLIEDADRRIIADDIAARRGKSCVAALDDDCTSLVGTRDYRRRRAGGV
jgi:hypothetical protein